MSEQWSRLSARMLLVHPLRSARELLPALLPFLVVSNAERDTVDIAFNLGALALVLGIAIVRWTTTRYRVSAEQVQLRHGLLRRETLTVPLDRVRTVDVEAGPLHRVLGLAKLVIGTGAQVKGKDLTLDGLGVDAAESLRVSLLHRATPAAPTAPTVADAPADAPADASADVALVRFDLAWLRYAPLSTTGLVTAFVAWLVLMQLLGSAGLSDVFVDSLGHALVGLGAVVGTLVAVVTVLLASVGGAFVSSVLTSWGHTVWRHDAGTLRITRGLLTTRSTTLDESRVRGVRLGEPALLRAAHGATLHALVTGSSGGEKQTTMTSVLLPATPRTLDADLAARVLGSAEPLTAPLRPHGRAATRRRWSRALQGALLVVVPAALATWWWHWPLWALVPLLAALLTVPPLARDRARGLGHALTAEHLVAREGSLDRHTDLLELDGVLGWDLRQTIFQRRVGVATLTATTATGEGGVRLLDVPLGRAYEIVDLTAARVVGRATAVTA